MKTELLVNKFGVTLSLIIKLANLKTNFPDLIHPRLPCLGHKFSHYLISREFPICNLINASVKGFWITTIWTNITCKTKHSIKISLSTITQASIITIHSNISITRCLPRTKFSSLMTTRIQHKVKFINTRLTTRTNNGLFNRNKRRRSRPITIDTISKYSIKGSTNNSKTIWSYFIKVIKLILRQISNFCWTIQNWTKRI